MARLGTAGAELQSTDRATEGLSTTTTNGSYTISTSVKRSGDAGYQVTASAVNEIHFTGGAVSGRWYYSRAWVYFPALPSEDRPFFRTRAGASILDRLVVRSTGKIAYVGPGGSQTDSSVTIGAAEWHCYELATMGNGTNRRTIFRVDGSQIADITGASANIAQHFCAGAAGGSADATWLVNIDDIALNDDQGSAQASYPGTDGHVVLLKPASDSAIGSDWKLGTGTTPSGNAYDAIDNTPPLGVANGTAGSDSKQIRDTVASVTTPASDAVVTLESYSPKVPSGSTVRIAQTVAMLGGSASSGNPSIDLVSTNPADTSTASPTSAVSTFPTSWVRQRGSAQQDPTVNQATAATIKIGKRSAVSTAALCCFAGLLIEYEAASVAALTGTADVAVSASSASLSGKAELTGTGDASVGASGTLSQHGQLTGSAPISFAGAVVPPTAKALLSGSAAIVFDATAASPGGTAHLTASAPISFTATLVPPTAKALLSGTGRFALTTAAGLGQLLPPRLSGDFTARWASGLHVGAARPGQRVQVRIGRFERRNDTWTGKDIDVTIHGVDNDQPWQAFWTPLSSYVEIPNVRDVELDKSAANRGLTTATVTIDNILYRPETAGHHSIKRGYMAPLRGYVGSGRTRLTDEQGASVTENEWFELLARQAQITVHQAYGDAEVETFTGLVDDVDTTSRPDVITITARCFGQVLTDERVFGWNKEPAIKDPVIFIDDDQADKITYVGSEAAASSELDAEHTADKVLDGDGDTAWISTGHSTRGNTEYVQIRLPQGRYNDFRVVAADGMDCYVSLNVKSLESGADPTWDGNPLTPNEWVDGQGGATVPGANGGIGYVRLISDARGGAHTYTLAEDGTDFVVGEGTLLRLSYRNLVLANNDPTTPYGAIVTSLKARHRVLLADAATQKWVRIKDVSDMVKQVLRWAGFKEWEIESTGVPLKKRFVVNRGMFYMDVIQAAVEATGYTFFIADPSTRAGSIGVPVFRRTRAVVLPQPTPIATVHDSDLLTAIQVHQTDEPLSYIIRVRGRKSTNGQRLGGSPERVMFTFRPPWSHQLGAPGTDDRMGGVLKHVIHVDDKFADVDDCKFGAYYIALQEALGSITATVQIPAYPGVDLDDHVELLDLATGVTSRLIVTGRQSSFTRTQQKTSWVMTLSGGLVDTADVTDVVAIIDDASRG